MNNKKRIKLPKGAKKVPIVKGGLPLIGHGIEFGKDIIGFVRKYYKEYGPIFRVKIWNKDIIIVSDRSLIKEYFRYKENKMSLYDVLNALYFGQAFSDDKNNLSLIIDMVKTTVQIKFDEMAPKILSMAKRMIKRLKKNQSKKINVEEEAIRFVSYTSAMCFIGLDMSDDFYSQLMEFTQKLNFIVKLTYFFPQWLLNIIFGSSLRKHRIYMTKAMESIIEEYRQNPNKNDSVIIRKSVDWEDVKTGKKLKNHEIGDIIVCLLYVSSENTALGLSAALIDLSCHEKYWNQFREESIKYLIKNKDIKGLVKSDFIHGCIMETARMTSHVFALMRKPLHNNTMLGEYHIGGCDFVALCEPMLMVYECAYDIFKNPDQYNPNRYLNENNNNKKEKNDPYSIMTWGAGVHLCPGKIFAQYEIKIALSLITLYFKRFQINKLEKLDYFSPSAFAERHNNIILEPIDNDNDNDIDNDNDNNNDIIVIKQTQINEIIINEKKYKIEYYQVEEGNGGWIIRERYNLEKQENLYKYTLQLSQNSIEQKEIINQSSSSVYPLTYYNLVYTGTHNCNEKPYQWFNEAQIIWNSLNWIKKPNNYEFDSVYAQLYGDSSSMKIHKDEYVNWGISISLGSSCDFQFGNHIIMLHSGDVFISDFSKVNHGVLKIYKDSQPYWWNNNNTFGKTRCSIQIRNVSQCKPHPIISREEFIKKIK